jgi:hypothetical protein
MLRSELCKAEHLQAGWYRRWCRELHEEPRPHRKQWEFAYVMQALWERGCIGKGKKGLAFAVGSEPLTSIFANYGCHILATDIAPERGSKMGWTDADQLCRGVESLNKRHLCTDHVLHKYVQYRSVDMNDIPADLAGFDFNWSSCSFEHLGSIEKGAGFLMNQLATLRPGGWSVHTTEFNISSNDDTLLEGDTVVYRRRDLEKIVQELRSQGHVVEELDYSLGSLPADFHVDRIPHRQDIHLRLQLDRFVVTSIGLIIMKKKNL